MGDGKMKDCGDSDGQHCMGRVMLESLKEQLLEKDDWEKTLTKFTLVLDHI